MTRAHSPWPLFCDDLDLARSWLRPQLQGYIPPHNGHVAISLGLGDELLSRIESGSLQTNADALRQWRFRVARLHGDTNPYCHLLPDRLFEQTLAAVINSKTTGLPLDVQLNGGIGDHIEALSMLLPWAKSQNCCLNLEMSAERQQQIEPLLPHWDQIQCNKNRTQGSPSIAAVPVMALRAAIANNAHPITYYNSFVLQKTIR